MEPRAPPRATPLPVPKPPDPRAAGIKVLAVDDDPFMRHVLDRVLTGAGMRLTCFSTAAELLAADELAMAQLVLLDVQLPGMSGLQLQQLLTHRGIQAPVVFISGAANLAMAVQAMRDGAVDFIEKPFTAALLIERVREAVARHGQRKLQADTPSDRAALPLTTALTTTPGEAAANAQTLARIKTLTPRERQVFDRMVVGLSSKLIARELGGSFRTVEIHRAQVMRKMEARHLADLVRMSIESMPPRREPTT